MAKLPKFSQKPIVLDTISDADRFALIPEGTAPLETRQQFAETIGKLWRDAQSRFIAIGHHLLQAKKVLPHGEWEIMVERDLPFGRSVAHRLRQIAEAIDTGRLPADQLPPDYSTCYQLTTLRDDELHQATKLSIIRPDVSRAEVIAFKRQVRAATASELSHLEVLPELADELTRLEARHAELVRELAAVDARITELRSRAGEGSGVPIGSRNT
jgi:hypothetical protein